MKQVILIFSLLAILSQCEHTGRYEVFQLFRMWESRYQKIYPTQEERQYRLSVFIENLQIIAKLSAENPDAIYKPTKFADLTGLEFQNKYLNSISKPNWRERMIGRPHSLIHVSSPDEWDWTTKEAVTTVKDQGECDSAWAQATIASIESYHAITHKELKDLAVQQLLDCDKSDTGCNGGNPDKAFTYIIEAGGVMSDYDYPYTGVVGPCKFEEEKVAAKVLDFSDIPKGDEAAFKESLYSAGPVVAMMNGESLQFYDGGVFDPLVCKVTKLTHVVSCVGYGVDPKKKKEFWKCKNSWGDNWGEQGFFRIIRGKNKCGIANDATYGHSK